MAIAAQCIPDSGRDLALNLQLVMQQLLLSPNSSTTGLYTYLAKQDLGTLDLIGQL